MSQESTNRSFDDLARGLAEGSISRRRALGLFAGTAIAALVPSTRALADDDDDGYTVCHVPGTPPNCDCTRARTIRGLSRRERARHLRNHPCDSRGNCRNNPYCGTTTSTTTSTTSTSTTSTSTSTTSPCPPGRVLLSNGTCALPCGVGLPQCPVCGSSGVFSCDSADAGGAFCNGDRVGPCGPGSSCPTGQFCVVGTCVVAC